MARLSGRWARPACPRRGCSPHRCRPRRHGGSDVTTDPLADLDALAVRLREVGMARGRTLATVESCTGGLIGHVITEVPGSSAYYLGGFVTYSDAQKRAAVGVGQDILA